MSKLKLLMLLLLISTCISVAYAYDFVSGGIYYSIVSDAEMTCGVVPESNGIYYSGDVVIPSTVKYNGVTYNVTEIAQCSFIGCDDLLSVSIPKSIVDIRDVSANTSPFSSCPNLKSITVDDANSFYSVVDGVLFNKDKTTLINSSLKI